MKIRTRLASYKPFYGPPKAFSLNSACKGKLETKARVVLFSSLCFYFYF
jgi:hypothetical protein